MRRILSDVVAALMLAVSVLAGIWAVLRLWK